MSQHMTLNLGLLQQHGNCLHGTLYSPWVTAGAWCLGDSEDQCGFVRGLHVTHGTVTARVILPLSHVYLYNFAQSSLHLVWMKHWPYVILCGHVSPDDTSWSLAWVGKKLSWPSVGHVYIKGLFRSFYGGKAALSCMVYG